jgi:O-methyltransferase involved in polyketide biosynthesis
MYVREEGNSATLRFIASQASGSGVVYDYVLQPIIERKYGNYHAAGIIAFSVERRGEPYVMGWTPRSAATFARQHGLEVVEDIDAAGLTRRHLTGSDGKPDGRMTDWLRIIEAKVP